MQEFEYRPNPTTPDRQDRRTIATPFDVEILHRKTKGFAKAIPGLACYHNAFLAVFGIMAFRPHQTAETFPRIMMMETYYDVHVYVEYRGKVYNQGVTWPNNLYPDYTLSEVKTKGEDQTHITLSAAAQDLLGMRTDPILGYADILRTVTGNAYSDNTLAEFIALNMLVIEEGSKK